MPEGIAIPHPNGKSFIKAPNSEELVRDHAHHQAYKAFKPIRPTELLSTESRRAEVAKRDLLAEHERATKPQMG